MKKVILFFAVVLFVLSLVSCSRYVREGTYGGGCGVWYPKKFNPNKASRWENPRGAMAW
jgi:hypothetical protein